MHNIFLKTAVRTLSFCTCFAWACHIHGADRTWDGSIGNWNTDASWLPGGVEPTSIDTVRIDGGQVTVDQLGEIANFIRLGDSGSGVLSVESGAGLTSNYAYLAPGNGTIGTATVTGAGSTWTVNQQLRIGSIGIGTLTISNGGLVDALDQASIGVNSNSNSTALVTGAGSMFNAYNLFVGDNGDAELSIASGGSVQVHSATIADDSSSTSSATVSGAGSSWGLVSSITIARSGDGSLTIDSGGSVSSNGAFLARSVLATGSVIVTGPGSTWTNTGSLFLGSGTGNILISAGGSVTNGMSYLGHNYNNSYGSVTVTGSGSTWTNTESLYIGEDGTGLVTIADGGVVNVADATYLKDGRFSSGSIQFDGGTLNTGTLYASPNDLLGTGTINAQGVVTDHNLVFNASTGNQLTFQLDALADQNVTVNIDASMGSTGNLGAGNRGSGSLRIEGGQNVYSHNAWLAFEAGSTGTATVSGEGSTWTNSGSQYVGYYGTGSLTIEDGAQVNSYQGFLGSGNTASGTVTVSGEDTLWANTNAVFVGSSGYGTLLIDSGATVTSNSGSIANFQNSIGEVTVTGTGSSWIMRQGFVLAYYGQATLNIDDGGHVDVAYQMDFEYRGGSSTLNFMLASVDDPLIDVGADANLAGILNVGLTEGLTLSDSDTFTLIDIGGTQTGTFDNVAEGDLIGTFNGVDLFLTYTGGDGNDVVAYAVLSALLGDADGDGDVDAFDITAVEQNFGNTGAADGSLLGDADHDGDVDAFDITAVEQNFGNTLPTAEASNANPIPEPSSLVLLSLGGLAAARRRQS